MRTRKTRAVNPVARLFWKRRPTTRRALWWSIGLAIPLAVTLSGGIVILWAVSRDHESRAVMSLGVTLFALGLAAFLACLGIWVASGSHRGTGDGP